MDVVMISTSRDLDSDERRRLKERIADAYREATGTDAEIGVDMVPMTTGGG